MYILLLVCSTPGYSVGSVQTSRGPLIVAGAPRRNMTGAVLVFEGVHLKQTLTGEQVGAIFGGVPLGSAVLPHLP